MGSSEIWAPLLALAAGATLWGLCWPNRNGADQMGKTTIPWQTRLQPARATQVDRRPSEPASRRRPAAWI
jgi:hypothetical protein